uniref:Uncharacterized protein n=1 Tax=Arundo donax TaxID=35708 RepID=A0A0A9F0W4_ARUDO
MYYFFSILTTELISQLPITIAVCHALCGHDCGEVKSQARNARIGARALYWALSSFVVAGGRHSLS